MAEPFQSYHRTLKLPCESVESGRAHKTDIDSNIVEAARSLAGKSKQLKCELDNDAAGHLTATLKTRTYVVSVQTQFGQNVAYHSGERRTFISYSVSAQTRVPALERAADSAERLGIMMKLAGGFAGGSAVVAGLWAVFKAYDHVVIPFALVAIAVAFGAWCGGKLGGRAGAALENHALSRAEAKGVASEADSLWTTLTGELDSITNRYERV